MAYNVGTAQGKFVLDGVRKTIQDLTRLKQTLGAVNLDYKTQRGLMVQITDALKAQSAVAAQAIGKEKYIRGAVLNTNKALEQRKAYLQFFQKNSRHIQFGRINMRNETQAGSINNAFQQSDPYTRIANTALKAKNAILSQYTAIAGRVVVATQRIAAGTRNLISRSRAFVTTKRQELAVWRKTTGVKLQAWAASKRIEAAAYREKQAIDRANKATNMWWRNFGRVAIGFSIAYRAINAVEYAIANITESFKNGIEVIDDYRSSIANVSGMLALLSSGLTGYQERYDIFKKVMTGTMRESRRYKDEYGLSMPDINNAYRELAQFGVVITKGMVKPTLNAIAVIKEVASTTGNTAKQVRQEIQALFTGQTRVTDQFGKMLKRMPELRDKIYGIASANVDNAQKWRLVIRAMGDYNLAVRDAMKTVGTQSRIFKARLSEISGHAIATSGVYQKWLDTLTKFNENIFDSEGNLTKLGEKVYNAFYRGWQIIDITISTVGRLIGYVGQLVKIAYQWNPKLTDAFITLFKIRVVTFVVWESFVGIYSAAKLLLKPLFAVYKLLKKIAMTTLLQIIPSVIHWGSVLTVAVLHPIKNIRNAILLIQATSWGPIIGAVGLVIAVFYAAWQAGKQLFSMIEAGFITLKRFTDAMASIEVTTWEKALSAANPLAGGLILLKKLKQATESLGKDARTMFIEEYEKALAKQGKLTGDALNMFIINPLMTQLKKGKDKIGEFIDGLKKQFGELFPELAKGLDAIKELKFDDDMSAEDMLKKIKMMLGGGAEEITKAARDAAQKARDSFDLAFKDIFKDLNREMAKADFTELENKVADLVYKIDDIRSKMMKQFDDVKWVNLGFTQTQITEMRAKKLAELNEILTKYKGKMLEVIAIEERRNQLLQKVNAIRNEMAYYQQQFEQYAISEKDWLQYKQARLLEILAIESRRLASLNPMTNAYIQQQQVIEQLRQEILANISAQDKFNKSAIEGFQRGLAEYTRELGTAFTAWAKMGKSVAEELHKSFDEFWLSALEGDINSFEDFFTSFGKNMNKILAEMLARMTMQWIASTALWKALTGSTGTGVGGPTSYSHNGSGGWLSNLGTIVSTGLGLTSGAYSGGSAGAASAASLPNMPSNDFFSGGGYDIPLDGIFRNAKGGLLTEPILGMGKSGKMYSFVEDGRPERVLSNADTRAYSGGGGNSINVPVNVQNGDNRLAAELQRGIERTVEDILRRHV